MKKALIVIIMFLTAAVLTAQASDWNSTVEKLQSEAEKRDQELYESSMTFSREIFEKKYGDEFTVLVKAPWLGGKGQKCYITFYIGRIFNPDMKISDYVLKQSLIRDIQNGLFSFFVKGDSVYVDYSNVEIKNLNTESAAPISLLLKNKIWEKDATAASMLEEVEKELFKTHGEDKRSRYAKAFDKSVSNAFDKIFDSIRSEGKKLLTDLISDLSNSGTIVSALKFAMSDIPKPLIEEMLKNADALEKQKKHCLEYMALDRNEYKVFDIPLVWKKDEYGFQKSISDIIIRIPVEIKEDFRPGDSMGFYFDGCEKEGAKDTRSEYHEWDLWELSGGSENTEENMVLVEGGTFMMGDEYGDLNDNYQPIHRVTLTKDYYMGKYEVTNAQYVGFLNNMGARYESDSGYLGNIKVIRLIKVKEDEKYQGITYANSRWQVKPGYENHPVNLITWWGAVEYCNWLSRLYGLEEAYEWDSVIGTYRLKNYPNNKGYRLPTEAEWEYAARGGKYSRGYRYSGSNNADEIGWYFQNSGDRKLSGTDADWNWDEVSANNCNTHVAGKKKPNELGIYDMSGNVWEWCGDNWYDYTADAQTDPYYQRPTNTSSSYRMIRGGSWYYYSYFLRVTNRDIFWDDGGSRYSYGLGFRLSRTR